MQPKRYDIAAESVLTDEQADKFGGELLGDDAYDILIKADEAADVYKPDGTPLLKYRPLALSPALAAQAFKGLERAAKEGTNRGMAAGEYKGDTYQGREVVRTPGNKRFRMRKHDGTVSNTMYAKPVRSGIVGYMDRGKRFPYCRLTAFDMGNPEALPGALPLLQEIDTVFANNMPDRYAAQLAYVQKTSPDFFIHGTAFTTVTVNMNFRTAVHKDAGDLKEGFGVISVIRAGEPYDGGYLCFPKYRCAVDIDSLGVCLADVHEWHGNTPIRGKLGRYRRMSLVTYYREGMHQCGTADEELDRARHLDRRGINK